MSFNHEIVLTQAELRGVSYENPKGTFPEAPVLSGQLVNSGDDADLSWTVPNTTLTIFGYEIVVDGNAELVVTDLSYLYEDLTFDQQYDFQVRAIGPLGVKSPLSNTVTLTGAGFPYLAPSLIGEYKGASVSWSDVSNNSYYTIEGYNVYFAIGHISDPLSFGSAINSSVLSTSFTRYAKLGIPEDTDITFGVSIIYDGGQESSIYMVPGRVSPIPDYWIVHSENNPPVSIISSRAGGGALVVKEGAQVNIFEISDTSYLYRKKWVSIYFNGTWETYFRLSGNFKTPRTYINSEGCANEDFVLKDGGNQDFQGNMPANHSLRGGWNKSFGWTVSGPTCGHRVGTTWKLTIANLDDILEDNVQRFNGNSRIDFEMYKFQSPTQRLTADVPAASPSIVRFSLERYKGLPYVNLYIKSQGGAYSTPYNGAPITDWPGNFYEVTDLAAGDYTAKIVYVFQDSSEYTDVETNEVNFTIS